MGVGTLKRAVFLDRDGTVNEALLDEGRPHPPASLSELRLVPHAKESIARLKAAAFEVIVVTNQPDVARGTQTLGVVEEINSALLAQLDVDDIRMCVHDDADRCDCRKPLPGLLVRAAEERGIQLARSFMVGDRWRDVEAGRAAGCRTVLIDRGYREAVPHAPDARVDGLADAVEWILGAD